MKAFPVFALLSVVLISSVGYAEAEIQIEIQRIKD